MKHLHLRRIGGEPDRLSAQAVVNAGQLGDNRVLVALGFEVEQCDLAKRLDVIHHAFEQDVVAVGGHAKIFRPDPAFTFQPFSLAWVSISATASWP